MLNINYKIGIFNGKSACTKSVKKLSAEGNAKNGSSPAWAVFVLNSDVWFCLLAASEQRVKRGSTKGQVDECTGHAERELSRREFLIIRQCHPHFYPITRALCALVADNAEKELG